MDILFADPHHLLEVFSLFIRAVKTFTLRRQQIEPIFFPILSNV